MTNQGYREEDLVKNRAPVLLIGGTEAERKAWAEEAATFFPGEGPLRVVTAEDGLKSSLSSGRGVVFIPCAVTLGVQGQGEVLRCLQYQEERPKIVVALGSDPTAARSLGTLREDLHYRLHLSIVNVATPGFKEVARVRRQKAEAVRKVEAARAEVAAKKAQAILQKKTATRTIPAKYPGGLGARSSVQSRASGATVTSGSRASTGTPVASAKSSPSSTSTSTAPAAAKRTAKPPARARPAAKKTATAPKRPAKSAASRRAEPKRPAAAASKSAAKKPVAKKARRK